jgi:1,4-dihydroxy-2-naphthoate octaprenyltransferase
LAILVGHKGAVRLYAFFMLLPFLLLGPLHWLMPEAQVWLAVGALPLAWMLVKRFPLAEGREFNHLLARTTQTQLLYGLLLAFGLAVS